MADYIRLSEPPKWCIQYPQCSACVVDLEFDDEWTCPMCGTTWGADAGDGDKGTLYAEWAGEDATGPAVSEDEAHHWGHYYEQAGRHERWPGLFAKPVRPDSK